MYSVQTEIQNRTWAAKDMTDILNPGKKKNQKKKKSVIHATMKKKTRIQLFASYRQ